MKMGAVLIMAQMEAGGIKMLMEVRPIMAMTEAGGIKMLMEL